MQNYSPIAVTFERGEGAYLWDTDGKRYLDALGGIAVCGLGHAHPAVTEAIAQQAARLLHTSNLYQIGLQEQLAERLTRLTGMENVFFCNSGAEANEAAIKIARLYGHARDISVPTLIATDDSFHGRTLATLSATGNPKMQQGFEPLVEGFVHVPYNDLDAIESAIEANPSIVGILVEPMQGESGIRIPAEGYLQGIRSLCDRHGLLMMLDEVQTGMGRTGRFLASQHESVLPDIVTMAKGLANGVPIGACLAQGKAATMLTPGTHGSTFGGNPLACAAALAVLDTIEADGLIARAAQLGQRILDGLAAGLADNSNVVSIRGKGLMIGVELTEPPADLVTNAMHAGLLINLAGSKVVRLLPPLIISDAQADQIVTMVCQLINNTTTA